jgi:hypothetical protein
VHKLAELGLSEQWTWDMISKTSVAADIAEAKPEVMEVSHPALESMIIITMISKARTQQTIRTRITESPLIRTICKLL